MKSGDQPMDSTSAELMRLADASIDSNLSESERRRLERFLSGQPKRMRWYLGYVRLHVALEEEGACLSEKATSAPHSATVAGSSPAHFVTQPNRGRQLHRSLVGSRSPSKPILRFPTRAVATAVAAAAALLLFLGVSNDSESEFRLTRDIDAAWSESRGAEEFRRGDVASLASGLARIDFACDAVVAVEGPATFRAISEKEIELLEGRLAALCPTKQSHGFTVRLPNGRVVDLGTEFGVAIDGESTSVRVFDGEVQWFDNAGNSVVIRGGRESRDASTVTETTLTSEPAFARLRALFGEATE
ncbi:FecR protein [Planctomycetes bacterium MalM25]|nr:FecR protein [Planctomycetes bacterium MalM25]